MDYELHVLRAAADGVQPALLLRAPGKKAEYLINVPDGFSRLALEQKLIPSARLSCVLLTTLLPKSTGGLGALFLRLKYDGHEQLQVIGPQGSYNIIHALRHICRWQHPKVFVSESCESQGPIPVFEDENVVIISLVADDQLTSCPWCLYTSLESLAAYPSQKKSPLATTVESFSSSSSSSSDCSGSMSDTSSDGTASTGLVQSNWETNEAFFEKSLSQFKACSDTGNDDQCKSFDASCKSNFDVSNGALVDGMSHFCPIERDSRDLKEVLPQRRKRSAVNYPLLDSDEYISGRVRDERLEVKKTKSCQDSFRGSGDVNCSVLGSKTSFNLPHDDERKIGLDERVGPSEDGNAVPTAEGNFTSDATEVFPAGASGVGLSKNPFVQSIKPYEWLLSNLRQDDLPQLDEGSNPVYALRYSTQNKNIFRREIENDPKLEGDDPLERNPARVLGYVVYLRKLNTAVLVVDCGGPKDLETLRRHPVLSCIYCTSGSKKDDETKISSNKHFISATLHLTPHSLVRSCDYQLWMASLRSPAHVVMNESSCEFGFKSSLAMLQRLNGIQPEIFPLPFEMVDTNSRAEQLTHEFTNSNVTIVDAEHSLCLKFCEEGTTWSRVSIDSSMNPPSVSKMTSIAESTRQVQSQLLFAKDVEVPRSNASTYSHVSSNLLAAIGIKRRLLQQKETILSSGTITQNRGTLANDETSTLCPVMNCTGQDCVCRSYDLPLTIKGTQEGSSGASHRGDVDKGAGADRTFNANTEVATPQVILEDKQAVTSSLRAGRICDLMQSQTRGLTPVQEYIKCHAPASEFQLVFLGTGCAEPSKKRGSSGILLQVKGAQGAMLLDAGEGAVGQLFRRFGEQGARTIISSLQCLWLSHKHGDHALGVISILQTRSTQAAPLVIIGPHKVCQWLSEVLDTCSAKGYFVPPYVYIHCEEISKSDHYFQNSQQHRKQLLEVLDAMQLNSMLCVKVFHCHDAYGIVLNGRHGWKLVYSGDTRPCKQLIEAGQGCTLLIHEATFEDSLVEQAKCKRHSTVSEAVTVGWEMRAQHIILTHFSQRYPEMVVINGDGNENLSVAFDGMVVPSLSLDLLGRLLPQIRIACQKTVIIPPSTGNGAQRRACTSKPDPGLHGESSPAVQENNSKEPRVARHMRWTPNSDDEANCQNTDDHAINTLTWSSEDSKDEAELTKKGGRLLMRNGSRSSFTGILNSRSIQRITPEKLSKLDGLSSYARETPGPLGGKHMRWVNSDSEDE